MRHVWHGKDFTNFFFTFSGINIHVKTITILQDIFCSKNTLMINNNNNNNRFLYSAFPNYDQSASQCIITPVIGFRINSTLRVHFLHSLGSIPASRHFTGEHKCQLNHNIVRILPGPHLTPGSRAAMWIKCLAEGQKYRATVGFEPGLSAWESSGHTTIPRHLHLSSNKPVN